MKAKLILTAMAMPVLFAACTSDELVPMEQTQQVVRPLLSENFEMTVKSEAKGDAETRYTVEQNGGSLDFEFNTGDRYGAALIDQPTSASQSPADWGIIPTSAGNLEFKYDADTQKWTTNTLVGVGHYFFSFKYNEADKNRGPVAYNLPTVQNLYTDEKGQTDLNAAIAADNKSVAAALLDTEDAGNIELKNIFAYPKFRVYFEQKNAATTVSKVVLEKTGGGFLTATGYDHKKVWYDMFDPEALAEYLDKDGNENKTEKDFWAQWETSDFIIDGVNDYESLSDYVTEQYSSYIVANFPSAGQSLTESVVEIGDIEKNLKYFDVRFMIPSVGNVEDGEGQYNMYIYTDNGTYKLEDIVSMIQFKNPNAAANKRALARNTSYNLNLLKGDAIITKNENKVTDFNIVTSKEDWNKLVEDYGNQPKWIDANDHSKGQTPYEVMTIGEEIAFDGDFDMPSTAIFKLNTDLYVSGNQTMSNVEVTKNAYVKSGATLNPGKGFSVWCVYVNEGGKVTFKGQTGEYTGVQHMENFGIVEAVDGNTSINSMKNFPGATLNINPGATLNFKWNLDNLGVVNVKADDKGTKAALNLTAGTNYAKDESITSDLKGGDVKATAAVPQINNYGVITSVDLDDNDSNKFTNKGKIVNYSGASVGLDVWYGKFVNAGTVDLKTGSAFNITRSTGTIILAEATQTGFSVAEGENLGTVEYSTKKADETIDLAANKNINRLKIGHNAKLKSYCGDDKDGKKAEGRMLAGVVEVTATVNLELIEYNKDKADWTTLNALTVAKEKTVTIKCKDARIKTLTLGKKAKVIVNKDNSVYATTLVPNTENGTRNEISVGGSFYTDSNNQSSVTATKLNADAKWDFNKAWTDGEEERENDAAEDALEAKKNAAEAAMKAAVEMWLGRINDWKKSKPEYYAGNPYDYAKFVNVLNSGYPDWTNAKTLISTTYKAYDNTDPFAMNEDNTAYTSQPAYFTTAVDNVIASEANVEEAKAKLYDAEGKWTMFEWTADATLYKNEDAVKTVVCETLSFAQEYVFTSCWNENALNAAYVWYAKTEVYNALIAKYPYTFIYDGCQLDLFMGSVREYTEKQWEETLPEFTGYPKDMDDILWMVQAVSVCDKTTVVGKAAQKLAEDYSYSTVKTWQYTPDQVQAAGK